jgi:hypothetical protein
MASRPAYGGTGGQMKAGQRGPWSARSARRAERGSVVLLTLIACLGVALCIQVLSVVVVCGAHVVSEEALGRRQLAKRDAGLCVLRSLAMDSWSATPWTSVATGSAQEVGRLVELEGALGWAFLAEFKDQSESTRPTAWAWVERGRDGLDLPYAALVATAVRASSERVTPWLVGDSCAVALGTSSDAERAAVGYVGTCAGPTLIGEGCVVEVQAGEWRLDEGWRAFLGSERSVGDRVFSIHGSDGCVVTLPDGVAGADLSKKSLVVVSGGADLDARWRGDVSAVIVVDEGSVLLEGTVVDGAVFAGDVVDVGLTGQVQYCRATLRWATDVSLRRTRLAPGTRGEGTR